MKITIIAPFTFGYIDALADKLKEYPNVQLTFIRFDTFKFEYASLLQRANNFVQKTFFAQNLKKQHVSKEIKLLLELLPYQDFILVLRPDRLEKKLLFYLKQKSGKLISYYFDAIHNFPKKAELIPFFDVVYSYEPKDVKAYGLRFITNFIPDDTIVDLIDSHGVFNISSYDERFYILEKLAQQLSSYDYPYRFIVRSEKPKSSTTIKIVDTYIPLEETQLFMERAAIHLDIQKEDQEGLSFRVFESLQLNKKLITTNAAIMHYDFYDERNILIIDKKKPVVPKSFLNQNTVQVAASIKAHYRRKAWLSQVFGI